jgi:crotonobetainyl-CoA:carnitine CoA-transferase CaiB-like acyl-CoA transferase
LVTRLIVKDDPVLLAPYLVLDLTDERGQLAGQMLAQLGAEVLAIEPPGGTRSRRLKPLTDDGSSVVHLAYNRGKQSIVLDLAGSEDDRATLRELVARADVVFESFDFDDELRNLVDYETLAAINPGIVVASISAFGRTGPKAGWAASDLTVWAASGPLAITGDRDRAPVRVCVPQAFLHASGEAAGAVVVALVERRQSGLGQHLDVSAQQASTQATQAWAIATPNAATPATRIAGGARIGTVDLRLIWPCSDGFVSISFLFGTAIGPFSRGLIQWMFEEGFCDEVTRDKDWVGYGGLLVTGEEPISEFERVKQLIEVFCLTKTKAELLAGALQRRLLIAPASDMADLLALDQFTQRSYWDVVDGVRYPGCFAKISDAELPTLAPAPVLGSTTPSSIVARPRVEQRPSVAPVAAGGRALDGLKVLDLMWVLAGPASSRVLADHGATVVRVESSTRIEVARTLQPFRNDEAGVDNSVLYSSLNAGKLNASVNLASVEGRAVIHDLIRWADVVLESFSPKAMAGWGLDYAAIKAINPRVVMLSSCLFGQSGPLSNFAGFGTMAAALSGFFAVTGWPDRVPCGPYSAYTDYISPRFSNAVLLAAIDHQQRTGEGRYIDFSQAEGAVQTLAPAILEHQLCAPITSTIGNADHNLHPHGVYPAVGEDRWVAIACADDTQRAALTSIVGSLDDDAIATWTSQRDPDETTRLLQSQQIPAHTVQNSPELIADPQLASRNHFLTLPHPIDGHVTIEAPRVVLSRTPARAEWAGATIGQHTYEVLTEILGYDPDRFADLAVSGALE